MPVLHSGKTEAQKCEGAHTRPRRAPVAKSLGCKGQTIHKPAVICPLPGHLQTLYGTRKRWLQRGQGKSLRLHGPLYSAAFDDHMGEGNGRGRTGDNLELPEWGGREEGKEGRKGGCCSSKALNPNVGMVWPHPLHKSKEQLWHWAHLPR